MSMCEECGNSPANVHLTQVINDQTKVFRLCEGCARKKGISVSIGMPPIETEQAAEPESAADAAVVCPVCEVNLAEFKEKGWLGCAQCYQAFADDIAGLLRRVHGSDIHRGKQYRSAFEEGGQDEQLKRLREEMQLAVRGEEFERAAAIRDKINTLAALRSLKTGATGR